MMLAPLQLPSVHYNPAYDRASICARYAEKNRRWKESFVDSTAKERLRVIYHSIRPRNKKCTPHLIISHMKWKKNIASHDLQLNKYGTHKIDTYKMKIKLLICAGTIAVLILIIQDPPTYNCWTKLPDMIYILLKKNF